MTDESKNTPESYDLTEDLKQIRNELVAEHKVLIDREMEEIKKDIDIFRECFENLSDLGSCDVTTTRTFRKKALNTLAKIYGVTEIKIESKGFRDLNTVTFGPKISDEIAKYEAAIEQLKKRQRV
jgi:hypothetical protein